MFPSKYDNFEAELLEKILEELNFQRTAVRRALVTGTTTGVSTLQLPDLERRGTQLEAQSPRFSKSKSTLRIQADDLSPRPEMPDSKDGKSESTLRVSKVSGDTSFKVIVAAPITNAEAPIANVIVDAPLVANVEAPNAIVDAPLTVEEEVVPGN
jgi:hypothetical protein